MSAFFVPVGVFALVVLLVAIIQVLRIWDIEVEVHQKLHAREMEHQRKMRELDLEIERIKQGR
jgi:hypothetical protein